MAEASPAKKGNPSDKRILVIDDDESVLNLMKATLEIEGFQVRTARDGRDILKKALNYKPDLIITDLMMPGGGGYEVLRSLQGDPDVSRIPVLMVTGSQMAESTQNMLKQESNLVGYLQKPVRPDTLVKNAHKALNTMSASDTRAQKSKENPVNFDDVF